MKLLYLILVATMLALSAAAQAPEDESTMTREQREQHHEQRVEERAVRHQNELKYMDSVVLSRNYKFVPNSFQQEPAGNMHQIYSVLYFLSMRGDYIDIDMPYLVGEVPPYHLTIMNYITFDIQKYTAVQDEDGWTVSFMSNLYSTNTYTFTFKIYSITREAVLTLASQMYPTVTYNGTVQAIY